MADGVRELRPVERIEVKLVDSVGAELVHQLDGDTRRDHPARIGIVVQPGEALVQFSGDVRTAFRRKLQRALEASASGRLGPKTFLR